MGRTIFAIACILSLAQFARADDAGTPWDGMFDEGRLLATSGVTSVEGSGGGGLATWATITGYGTHDGVGVNAHFTYVNLPDYSLWSPGVSAGLFDRVELSYAYQTFNTENVGVALGLGQGYEFHQNVIGAKVRLLGNIVYDQDTLMPELSAGLQFKSNDRGAVIQAVGGHAASGTDFYIAATKLFLAQSLLVNATLRETKANQFGILGFGGDKNDGYSTEFEGSAAYLLNRKLAVGAEYRTKPDNLSIAREDNAFDLFAAYFLDKHLSVTAAYVDLGNIVIRNNQHGVYLSLQSGF